MTNRTTITQDGNFVILSRTNPATGIRKRTVYFTEYGGVRHHGAAVVCTFNQERGHPLVSEKLYLVIRRENKRRA